MPQISLPRQLTTTPEKFTSIPIEFQQSIIEEINDFNAFITKMQLTREQNANFLLAIHRSASLLLHRTVMNYNTQKYPIYFEEPVTMYTSGYLIATLTEHAAFFMAMDECFYPPFWILIDITKNRIDLIVKGKDIEHLSKLLIDLKKVKLKAREKHWQGQLMVTSAFDTNYI